MAEHVPPQTPLSIVKEQGRRSAHLIGGHCARDCACWVGFIDANRKADAVFVKERFERNWRHGVVMLKDRVKTDDANILFVERFAYTLSLRQALSDAARA